MEEVDDSMKLNFCVSILLIFLFFSPPLWPHLFSLPSTARALIQYCRQASTGSRRQTMQKRQGNGVQGKQAVGPHESSRLETTRLRPTWVDTQAVVCLKTQRWRKPTQHQADPHNAIITVKSGSNDSPRALGRRLAFVVVATRP